MKIPIPPYIASLTPYGQSKPKMGKSGGQKYMVRLSANENPLGPSPKAAEAIKNYLSQIHKYPSSQVADLRQALAARLGLPEEGIICGNGSDELLDLAVRTFMRIGEEGICPWPSFVIYKLVTALHGGVPVVVPLKDFHIDVETTIKRVTERTRVVFLASPNNPTGYILSKKDLNVLMANIPESVLVVIDEAYAQFVRDESYPDLVKYAEKYSNLLVLRTFSKYFGLAGLRIGFGFGNPELISYLHRVRLPYNVNSLAQIGALASLSDKEHQQRTLQLVHQGIDMLYGELDRMGIEYLESEGNFILVNTGKDGREVADSLMDQGVEVRPMADYALENYIRVTVGMDRENSIFIQALEKALQS